MNNDLLNDYEKLEVIAEALENLINVFMRDERWQGVDIKEEADHALELARELLEPTE